MLAALAHQPVFITGYAREIDDRLGDRSAEAAVVQKPFKRQELGAAVRRVLAQSHRSDRLDVDRP